MNFVGTEDLIEFMENVVNQYAIFFLPLFIPNIVPLVSKDVVVIGAAGNIQGLAQCMDIVLALQLFQRISPVFQRRMDGAGTGFEDHDDIF